MEFILLGVSACLDFGFGYGLLATGNGKKHKKIRETPAAPGPP